MSQRYNGLAVTAVAERRPDVAYCSKFGHLAFLSHPMGP